MTADKELDGAAHALHMYAMANDLFNFENSRLVYDRPFPSSLYSGLEGGPTPPSQIARDLAASLLRLAETWEDWEGENADQAKGVGNDRAD